MKTISLPPKRRKMSVVNEEDVDKTLMESPKKSLEKSSTPTSVQVTIHVVNSEEGSKEEQEGDSKSELDSLSSELCSIATT